MSAVKVFRGCCTEAGPVVTVKEGTAESLLPARPDLTVSPVVRYAWRRGGAAGAEQLAAAILAQVVEDEQTVRVMVSWFAAEVVRRLPATFRLTSEQVWDWLLRHEPLSRRRGMPRFPRRRAYR